MKACRFLTIVVFAIMIAGCGATEITVSLQPREVKLSYGSSVGTVLTIPCTCTCDDCSPMAKQIGDAAGGFFTDATAECGDSMQHCLASLTKIAAIDLAITEQPEYTSAVAGKQVSGISGFSFEYSVPKNSLTFDVTGISLAVAAQGADVTLSETTGVGTIGPLARMQTITQGTTGGSLPSKYPRGGFAAGEVGNPAVPLQLLVQVGAQLHGGDVLPAGEISLILTPTIKLTIRQTTGFIAPG